MSRVTLESCLRILCARRNAGTYVQRVQTRALIHCTVQLCRRTHVE